MAGIGWGLLSAVLWGSAAVVSARASRLVGPWAVVAWVALIGIVVTLPIALATGTPEGVPGVDWLWAAIAGSAAIGGLFLAYWAVRIGQVSLVTPIIAIDGAIAAVIAVLAGEEIAAAAAGVLAVIAVGVTLASVQRAQLLRRRPGRGDERDLGRRRRPDDRGRRRDAAGGPRPPAQYAVVAMIGGYVVFKERLTPLQLAGVALTMSGVGALTAVQA